VTTVSTPGETVDVLVTERGIAVNPLRPDLIEKMKKHNVPVMTIKELQNVAEKMIGKPEKIQRSDKIVSVVEYRDGTIIDVVYQVKG
jgi:citrate lyase subunit alpha/citrate CoA-transferase